ncbi:MAG: lysylphosphatidylglycerol synthase transmembrane domain-containing protein [Lautropia sp.]
MHGGDPDPARAGREASPDGALARLGASRSALRMTVAGLVVGALFLWIAIGRVDVAAIGDVLGEVRWPWAGVTFATGVAFVSIKAWRWARMLRPLGVTGFGGLLRAVYAGTAANLTVSHVGELVRIGMVARRHGIAISTLLASVALERILDFVALVGLVCIGFVLDPTLSPLLWPAGIAGLTIVAVGLAVAVAVLNADPRLVRAGRALARRLPARARAWLDAQFARAGAGLGALRDPGALLTLTLLSLAQWCAIVAAIWAGAKAVDVDMPAPSAIVVYAMTAVGLLLPSLPAQLGTTQLAFVAGFALIGEGATLAFAASIVYTAFVMVATMIVGAGCVLVGALPPARRRDG